MQAPKELILSVLEDVSRGFSTSGYPTRRQEVLNASRPIYLKASPLSLAPLTAVVFLVAGLLALQYPDRLDGLLAFWLFGFWLPGFRFG